MKKAKARMVTAKKRMGRPAASKKSAPKTAARTRAPKMDTVIRRADQDVLLGALTDLLEVTVEVRELLSEIRDALVAEQEAESGEVDTVIIAEEENPESEE